MFNEYLWSLYLNAGGREIVDFFEYNLTDGGKNYSETYALKIRQLHGGYCPSPNICDKNEKQLLDLIEPDEEISSVSSLDDLWERIAADRDIEDNSKANAPNILEEFIYSMAYYTTLLHIENPELYVPYYFQHNFNVFSNITEQFSIPLPPIPAKKDHKGRFYYYGEICHALNNFRNENSLSTYELCAFLYDYAPNYIGGIDSYIVKDLPEPSTAYFIGSSQDDIFLSSKPETIIPWQCNPDTKAGDMIAMYLKTPISAVDSIWRSVSIGFNDPFFWYYRCTFIGHPRTVTRIPLAQMRHDSILGEMSIVRKNMQGVNGVELMPSQYNHLLKLGQYDAPRLDDTFTHDSSGISSERDVEKQLIEPLIIKLGYSESDYASQLQIRVGHNNFVLIPDYVLLPLIANGHHTAFAIIEAKHTIPTEKELNYAKIQVRSYAKQLGAKYAVIASKEGLLLTTSVDDYDKIVFSATFGELQNDNNVFSKLKKFLSHPL